MKMEIKNLTTTTDIYSIWIQIYAFTSTGI